MPHRDRKPVLTATDWYLLDVEAKHRAPCVECGRTDRVPAWNGPRCPDCLEKHRDRIFE